LKLLELILAVFAAGGKPPAYPTAAPDVMPDGFRFLSRRKAP
jgi:hypothetical protein